MNEQVALLATSAASACVTHLAQERPAAAGAGLPERFRQLDRSRDGTVTRGYAP